MTNFNMIIKPFLILLFFHTLVSGGKRKGYQYLSPIPAIDRIEKERSEFQYDKSNSPKISTISRARIMANGVSVPGDFPDIQVTQYETPAPGKLFFASALSYISDYIIILNNDGTPYFYRRFGHQNTGLADFKMHENGLLTYFTYMYNAHFVLNQNYEVIDTLRCAHGYQNNNHDMIMKDGHVILIADNPRVMDMSKIVSYGHPSAFVVGMNIQEFDDNGSLIFEWSTWDHLAIEHAIHADLTKATIDLVHLNSVAVDYDDNLIMSLPKYDQVIKVDRHTGEIIWYLGGVLSDFEFINDPDPFSSQHDVRPVTGHPNHYTIFDNGNYRDNSISRGVEYYLDTDEKTAEKVWEYIPEPERSTFMMGSLQVLPNGNRLIDWSTWAPVYATEVSYEGDMIYELRVDECSTYRTRRYEWEGMLKKPYLIVDEQRDRVNLVFNKFGDENVDYYKIYRGTSPNPTALYDTSKSTLKTVIDLENNQTYYFRVTAVNNSGAESNFSNEEMVYTSVPSGENMVQNGDFSAGINHWICSTDYYTSATWSIDNGLFHFNVINSGGYIYSVQLLQAGIKLVQGKEYTFEFDARAEAPRNIEAIVAQSHDPYINYSSIGFSNIPTTEKHFSYTFKMIDPTDINAGIVFNVGQSNSSFYFDNISLKEVAANNADETKEHNPLAYKLLGNYPNPFNAQTSICFELPKRSSVKIQLYNLLGQFVEEICNNQYNKGKHRVLFNARTFSSGIYFYLIEVKDDKGSNSFRDIGKMMLIK